MHFLADPLEWVQLYLLHGHGPPGGGFGVPREDDVFIDGPSELRV